MTYSTLQNDSALGLQQILNFPNLDTPLFYPIFLFVIFAVFTSISFFREVSREGKGNLLSSLAVAGYVTIAVAVILSIMDLIQTATLVITLVASLVFQIMFMISKKD